MSVGEICFLALVIACFSVFVVAAAWLRADYVKSRDQPSHVTARLHAQMAE